MTRETYLYVLDPIDPAEVFARANVILGARPDGLPTDVYPDPAATAQAFGYDLAEWLTVAPGSIGNKRGQELPASLLLRHGNGQPLRTDPEMGQDGENMHLLVHPTCWLDLEWETSGGAGVDVSALHVQYLREMGAWLDGKQVAWMWREEYTGTMHPGSERPFVHQWNRNDWPTDPTPAGREEDWMIDPFPEERILYQKVVCQNPRKPSRRLYFRCR